MKPSNMLSMLFSILLFGYPVVWPVIGNLQKNFVVLGAGILGRKATPLLAARNDRGIELLSRNPNAVLLMSGGRDRVRIFRKARLWPPMHKTTG